MTGKLRKFQASVAFLKCKQEQGREITHAHMHQKKKKDKMHLRDIL